jgi:hypothetical protein
VRRADSRAWESSCRTGRQKDPDPDQRQDLQPADRAGAAASWDAAQKEGHDDDITDWKLLGPFKTGTDEVSLKFAPVSRSSSRERIGPDLSASYKVGDNTVAWKEATASKKALST